MVRLVFYFLSDFRRNVCKTTMMKQDRRPPFTSGQELLGYRECSKFHKKSAIMFWDVALFVSNFTYWIGEKRILISYFEVTSCTIATCSYPQFFPIFSPHRVRLKKNLVSNQNNSIFCPCVLTLSHQLLFKTYNQICQI